MTHFRILGGTSQQLLKYRPLSPMRESLERLFVPSYQDKVCSMNTNKLSYLI